MNRLRILLIGAALITGGSALASAQTLQEVAYHDQYRDRHHDDRRVYDHYRDSRFDRGYRFDHGRRYENSYRYVNGRRAHWDGHRWIY
jgi:hypothetical protein